MSTHTAPGPRRSVSAVVHSVYAESPTLEAKNAQPRRSLSGQVNSDGVRQPSRMDPRRLSLNENSAREIDRTTHMRRQSAHQKADDCAADLTAYFAFSRRKSSIVNEDQTGLSGFLEYRKLDGSWRPFLFQTIGYQLVVFRVHVAHQVQVMSTDIRQASEIALVADGDVNNTRLFRLGINNTVITLRAVTHHVAVYWTDGLQQLRAGRLPDIIHDRPTIESEDDIFRQIDQMSHLREWRPPPPVETSFCGGWIPCFGSVCPAKSSSSHAAAPGTAAFATTHSPRPLHQTQKAWG